MNRRVLTAKELGDRLRNIRGIRTRTGVAKAIGISPSRLGNYELGYAIPPDEIKVLLADYYGTTVEDLFYAVEYKET